MGVAVSVEVQDDGEATEIWDVNKPAFDVFGACVTQWRVAVGPQAVLRTGLDYAGVDVVMRRLAPAGADHRQIFGDLHVKEAAAHPNHNEAVS